MVKSIITCVLVSLLGVACQWESDGNTRLGQLYPSKDVTKAEVSIPDVTLPDVDADSLSGHWVLQILQPGSMNILGLDRALLMTDLFLVEADPDGGKATLTFCHQVVALDAGGLGETVMPETTREALAASPVDWTMSDSGILGQQVVWTWGLDSEFPLSTPLPSDPEDPAVLDQDEDGPKGVTIHVLVPEGDRYMVRRSVWNLNAADVDASGQWIRGTLSFTVEEAAVGYSGPSTLATVVPIVPSPEGGTYQMAKVAGPEGTGWSCQQLMNDYLGIFHD
jgi:hypothetical protein